MSIADEAELLLARDRIDELSDALRGLYGLLQLYAGRSDCPSWLKEWRSNHRAIEVERVLPELMQ